MTAPVMPSVDIAISTHGSVAEVTLSRGSARNALTAAMRAEMAAAFPAFARDPQIYCVVMRSAVDETFSAGGDIREITQLGRTDPAAARRALRDEYALNWLLECFSKPTVSLIDGLVVGSGVGITLYGTHRVAGPGYRFAMPETSIGLFPDDGVAHTFARMPDHIGVYLGLTGRRLRREDAYHLGLVTHCISPERYKDIVDRLAEACPVDPLLDGWHEPPGSGELAAIRSAIARCFSASTVEEILERLTAERGTFADWARGVRFDLLKRCPLSLKVTLRHIREAAGRDLRQTLMMDYRLGCGFLDGPNFYEGVRSLLIDKDNTPRWTPADLASVSAAMVEDYFAARSEKPFVLPTRTEMQAARV